MTLLTQWLEFVTRQSLSAPFYMSGVQKIRRNVVLTLPGDEFFDGMVGIESFGYVGTGGKLKILERHYLNHERRDAALELIKLKCEQRSYGSVQFPLTGEVKKWTNQDFCMSSCTVTYFPGPKLEVTIFYRTTEIIKKFGADLIFLRDVVLPSFHALQSIDHVTFVFSNLTVHPMFYTTFLAHQLQPITFLKLLDRHDPRFHQGVQKWMQKYLFEGETSWVQKFSQAKQTLAAMERLMDDRTERKLKQYFKRRMK